MYFKCYTHFYSKRTLFDILIENQRRLLLHKASSRRRCSSFSLIHFVNQTLYLLCKVSSGHLPIYQSHPKAMFHTMSHTCISEVLGTLWKPLSPKHQLMINTGQDRELSSVHTTLKKFENAINRFFFNG